MIIGKDIPMKNQPEGVRKIIVTPEDKKYPTMLVSMEEKDIKAALKIMKQYNAMKGKQELCSAELKMRKAEKIPNLKSLWAKWFTAEWNDVRKAAGKI